MRGMSCPNIWYFIKFFAEETHADQFIAGGMYMNTLSHFKQLESECDDGRPDATEAVSHWWQPNDILMKLSVPGIGETEISNKDLAGPVSNVIRPSRLHTRFLLVHCPHNRFQN